MECLAVIFGASIGAPLRYLIARYMQSRHDSLIPWGTFLVNMVGSFLLGLCSVLGGDLHVMVAVGFCGALSTYSTFSYETTQLIRAHGYVYALANVVMTVVGGVVAYGVGDWLIKAIISS